MEDGVHSHRSVLLRGEGEERVAEIGLSWRDQQRQPQADKIEVEVVIEVWIVVEGEREGMCVGVGAVGSEGRASVGGVHPADNLNSHYSTCQDRGSLKGGRGGFYTAVNSKSKQ